MSRKLAYLLDTNMLSELIRHPNGAVAKCIAAAGEDSVCTSVICAAELRYGAEKSGSAQLADRVGLVLSAIEVLALEPAVDHVYAELRHHLTSRGRPIGPNDLLIAAHALAENLVVVTANEREFSRVPGLPVENWLEKNA